MIEKYNYEGDTNLGFFATVTGTQAVLPPDFKKKDYFEQLEIVTTFIAGTRLVGLFTAGNSNCVLVPSTIKENEREKLEDSGIDFHVLDSKETALGNLILANDHGALVSERIEDSLEEIEEALGVEAEVGKVAGLPNPGVSGMSNSLGVLLHRECSEEEAEKAKEVLGVEKADIGSVNLGSPYIGSGIIGNNEKIMVGEDTSGPEIGRIDRTLQEHE